MRKINRGEFILLLLGFQKSPPQEGYPLDKHPESYHLNWEKGRTLKEFQLIYISEGSGILEVASNRKFTIQMGYAFLIFPGEWHRYKPDFNTGWTEYYLGFSGDNIQSILKNDFINKDEPVYQVGYNEELIKSIMNIIRHAKEEKTYYQQYISSEIIAQLSKIIYISKNRKVEKQIEPNINRAKFLISQSLGKTINISQMGLELNMSYSKFRKAFKEYVGISPGQHKKQLITNRAKELLTSTDISIKELSMQLGFNNEYHFNTFF